jgi:hypothetical protein
MSWFYISSVTTDTSITGRHEVLKLPNNELR